MTSREPHNASLPNSKVGLDAGPAPEAAKTVPSTERELGGPRGPEPTRYGDWEIKGRCIDF